MFPRARAFPKTEIVSGAAPGDGGTSTGRARTEIARIAACARPAPYVYPIIGLAGTVAVTGGYNAHSAADV